MRSAFEFAASHSYEALVTMDADWQHEPSKIPQFFDLLTGFDLVSGSRYLEEDPLNDQAPKDRRNINAEITKLINQITNFNITDAFCGFKAYSVKALSKLNLSEDGYAMPLQFWIQANHFQFKIREMSVPRIYSDPNRQFAGPIKDPSVRLSYYHQIIEKEVLRWKK